MKNASYSDDFFAENVYFSALNQFVFILWASCVISILTRDKRNNNNNNKNDNNKNKNLTKRLLLIKKDLFTSQRGQRT